MKVGAIDSMLIVYVSQREDAHIRSAMICCFAGVTLSFKAKMYVTNQKPLSANAHANRRVFQARLSWQVMVKLNKGSIFVITETQFAIQSQVM